MDLTPGAWSCYKPGAENVVSGGYRDGTEERNDEGTRTRFRNALEGIEVGYEEHVELKKRVPGAIGIIRTGDTVQWANLVLRSG